MSEKVNKLDELMAACKNIDAQKDIQKELKEVLKEFQMAHEGLFIAWTRKIHVVLQFSFRNSLRSQSAWKLKPSTSQVSYAGFSRKADSS